MERQEMRYSCGLELRKRRLEFPAKEKKLIRSGLPELWLRRPSVSVIWKKRGTGVERSWMHLCVGHTSAIISRSDFIKQIYSGMTLILWMQRSSEKILPDLNTPQKIWCSFYIRTLLQCFVFKYITRASRSGRTWNETWHEWLPFVSEPDHGGGFDSRLGIRFHQKPVGISHSCWGCFITEMLPLWQHPFVCSLTRAMVGRSALFHHWVLHSAEYTISRSCHVA